MTWKIVRKLGRLSVLGADRLVNGTLLHPRRRGRTLAVLGLAIAIVSVTWVLDEAPAPGQRLRAPDAIAASDATLDREVYLMGRPWLDAIPRGDRDRIQVYFFDETTGAHVNVESGYRFTIELFRFAVRDRTISFDFPHGREKGPSEFTIQDQRGRGALNLKLTLAKDFKNGGKAKEYFSSLEDSAALPEWIVTAAKRAIADFERE